MTASVKPVRDFGTTNRLSVLRVQLMAGEMTERIGARIRERRVELGMKQRELADKLGSDAIDNQRISDWERGVNRPSDRYMEKLAAALDRDVSWFFREDTNAKTPDLSLVKPDDDRLARIEQRLEQLEIAVEHQNANLARQSAILERIEEREQRIFKVLEDAEVIERAAADGERELPEWPAPPSAAPPEPQRATETTDHTDHRAQGQRRKPA